MLDDPTVKTNGLANNDFAYSVFPRCDRRLCWLIRGCRRNQESMPSSPKVWMGGTIWKNRFLWKFRRILHASSDSRASTHFCRRCAYCSRSLHQRYVEHQNLGGSRGPRRPLSHPALYVLRNVYSFPCSTEPPSPSIQKRKVPHSKLLNVLLRFSPECYSPRHFWSILKRFSFDVPFRLLDRFRIDLESMIHRFWNGFHFWLRPILDRFLIDCWSILNCIFSFLQKSRKHAQNAKRTGHSSQFFVHEKRTFPFSEYHINAFKLAVYFTRNVDLPFNVWSFWIDCWTPSAIENNSHETHPKNQHSAHGKNRIFKCIFVRFVEWKKHVFH